MTKVLGGMIPAGGLDCKGVFNGFICQERLGAINSACNVFSIRVIRDVRYINEEETVHINSTQYCTLRLVMP